MELTREIYWNVGHGATTLVPMYLFFLLAAALLIKGFLDRLKVYKQGLPLDRKDEPASRLQHMLRSVLLQTKVMSVKGPGVAHALFFWSFVMLVIGTTLIVIQADFTDLLFDIRFLKGPFYLLFSITLDLAGLIAIVMLLGLLVRRYLVKPEGLDSKKDDVIMHGLMLTILVTGFLIEGSRMAVTEMGTNLAAWSPVGNFIGNLLASLNEESLRLLHKATWWFHFLLVMTFFVLIPRTKFRHIFTTSSNYFFMDRGPKGNLTTMDLEDEEQESFGAASIQEMSWKDIFDGDACTLCKRCQDQCPAHATGKPLSPMKVVNQLGEVAFDSPEINLIDTVTKDVLWACTTCRACQEICPASIEHVKKIVEMRRNLVLMEGEFPGEEVMTAMEQTEVNSNPLGLGYASRGEWCEDMGVPIVGEDSGIDILYFVGCYGSFDKRNMAVSRSFIKLCQAAGISVGILGKEEKCCGEPMRKMGNEYLYQSLAMENIETLKKYEIKKIVTSCPHCYNTLAKDYKDLGLEVEVVSYTVFLEQLLTSGKLKINGGNLTCTYHDSCYLGRYNDIYSAPRALINAAGGKIVEMEKSRDRSFCCSGGGGRIMAEENIGDRMNIARVRMAEKTGAPTLVSNCPFCLTMFEDGIKGAELDDKLHARDIAEVLADNIQ